MSALKISARKLSKLVREAAGMNSPAILLQHAYDEVESLRTSLMRLKTSGLVRDPATKEALSDAITSAIVAMNHISMASDAMAG